jgi:hypothetical protein
MYLRINHNKVFSIKEFEINRKVVKGNKIFVTVINIKLDINNMVKNVIIIIPIIRFIKKYFQGVRVNGNLKEILIKTNQCKKTEFSKMILKRS